MTDAAAAPDMPQDVREFLNRPKQLWIDGAWCDGADGTVFRVNDPATGEALCEVSEAVAADVERAVDAARRALDGPWAKLSPSRRARLLWRLAELIDEHRDELAAIESLDTGKPLSESAKADLPGTAEHFRYFAGWCTKLGGQTLPVSFPGEHLVYTRREPVGVVGAIVPWNFPLLIASWKLAPALCAGNTVVLKPSEITPLSALRLAELTVEAGFPDGVINVLPGLGPVAGAALVQHPGVDKLSFTGSPGVGREILRQSAERFARVTLELGGKSPNIVFADADMDAAVFGALSGVFFNQGEICAAGSRLFVERGELDRVVAGVTAGAAKLRGKQGPGLNPATRLGPLVSDTHMGRVLDYIERGKAEGAELLVGGGRNAEAGGGYFVEPTVFLGRDDLTIAREEIFGPVLTVLPFDDLEEVVGRANATDYGLAAGVWSRDVAKALKVAHRLRAGTVWVNGYNLFDAAAPWGGVKHSGLGREKGEAVLDAFTELKTVWLNLG